MSSRLTIYQNTTGHFLSEVRAKCPRSWVLNGVGEAEFEVPYSSPKYREEYLMPGNMVVVEDPKLPDWGGIISDDLEWTQNALRVKCYDAAQILKTRMTEPSDTYYGSAGSIIKKMFAKAGQYRDTHFQLGAIYDDGVTREMKQGDSVYNNLVTLQKRTGSDWMVTPKIYDGKCYFEFAWMEAAGVTAASILMEGANLERNSNPLSQRGPIINSIVAFSEASDPKKRLRYVAEDEASMGRYDVRQMSKVYAGVKNLPDLMESAKADLRLRAWPTRATQFAALDRGNVFNDLRLGNIIQVNYVKVGFTDGVSGLSEYFRILGMKSDDRGRCEITGWQVYS